LSTHYTLYIPHNLHAALIAHALVSQPNECCGLLAGRHADAVAHATQYFRLVNDAGAPSREYRSDSKSLLAAHRAMRDNGLNLVAVCHSHPTSAAIPSRKDLADNAYGDSVMHLIISLLDGQPDLKAWWLSDHEFVPGKWQVGRIGESAADQST